VRLLFDEQLSARLCSTLGDIYPGSLHVAQIGLSGAVRERREGILRFGSQDDVTFLSLGW
jgi:predicted nuclease of predicted toxin-antitoxin system